MEIQTRYEHERGCGYRKPGGLYLIGGDVGTACGKLPIPLTVCPCCNQGVKFSRGFTWINSQLVASHPCGDLSGDCDKCTVWNGRYERYGLMWVGEKFYPTPGHFLKEAASQGVSKRIAAVPKDFQLGVDWVLLAHRKAVNTIDPDGQAIQLPGIFQAFKPTAIEYVVKGDESQEELERLAKRGITLVDVKPAQMTLKTYDHENNRKH